MSLESSVLYVCLKIDSIFEFKVWIMDKDLLGFRRIFFAKIFIKIHKKEADYVQVEKENLWIGEFICVGE